MQTPSLLCPSPSFVDCEARKTYPIPVLVLLNARLINNKIAVLRNYVAELVLSNPRR